MSTSRGNIAENTGSEDAFDRLISEYDFDAPPLKPRIPTREEQIERAYESKTDFSEWLHYISCAQSDLEKGLIDRPIDILSYKKWLFASF